MIITVQNDTFDFTGGSLTIRGQTVTFRVQNGEKFVYNYSDTTTALTAFNAFSVLLKSNNGTSLTSISPTTFVGSVGATVTLTGTGFTSTSLGIFIDITNVAVPYAYQGYVSQTTLSLVVAGGGLGAGTYNVYYLDIAGNMSVLLKALIVT